jgi:hypothetical protein
MNIQKETFREIVKQMSELSYNSQRILKWSKILSDKLSNSQDFTGKEEIMNDFNKFMSFIEMNLVDDMNDMFTENYETWENQLNKIEIKNESKIFQFENDVRDGKYTEDIKKMSSKYIPHETELEDLTDSLIESYRSMDDNEVKEFMSVYDSNPEECHEIIQREIYYYIDGNPDAMVVNYDSVEVIN